MHEGRETRLPGRYPDEVQPLVDDLNRLLSLQELALARARTQAGDVAHGLKTPLAVLSALARKTEAGSPAIAEDIEARSRRCAPRSRGR